MKKKPMFVIGDVITAAGAAGTGYLFYLGLNYAKLGEGNTSNIIFAAAIALVLCAAAVCARNFKRTHTNFKAAKIGEVITLLLFAAVMAFGTFTYFGHYFAVQAQKDTLRRELLASINQVDSILISYNTYAEKRQMLYKAYLDGLIVNKGPRYTECGFKNDEDDIKQINLKMTGLQLQLFRKGAVRDAKEQYVPWLQDVLPSVERWRPIGVVDAVKEIGDGLNGLVAELKGYAEQDQTCEQDDGFTYNLRVNSVKESFMFSGYACPPLGLAAAGLAAFIMLVPYIFVMRSSKGRKSK